MIAHLPDWAEQKFALLCAEAGVIQNRSIQDRMGWDFLVEFPAKRLPMLPHDMQSTEKSARVQIKSRANGQPVAKIKLSNALRFAKDPAPCFVVLFLGSDNPRIYAKHFWTDLIAKSLKAARQADSAGRSDLNRIMVTVSFTDDDDHTNDLLEWMQSCVEDAKGDYATEKMRLNRTLGYEDGSITGTIKFLQADLQRLVDHQIGLEPTAPIKHVTIVDKRFGMEARRPLFSGEPTFTNMQSHPQPCRLRIRGEGPETVWLDGQVHLPSIPGLELDLLKLRIVTDILELVISAAGPASCTVKMLYADKRTLTNLRAAIDFGVLAGRGMLSFQLRHEGRPPLDFKGDVSAIWNDEWMPDLSLLLRGLEAACEGSPPTDLTLSIDDLGAVWDPLFDFTGLLIGSPMKMKLNVDLDQPLPDGVTCTTQLGYSYVDVGGWAFLAVVSRPAELKAVAGGYEVVCGEPRVVDAIVRQGVARQYLPDIRARYDDAKKEHGNSVVELFGGDLNASVIASKSGIQAGIAYAVNGANGTAEVA